MNKKKAKKQPAPSESNIRWEYFVRQHQVPVLQRGDIVLVEYGGRNRVAIVQGRVPGGIYWAQLCNPVHGATRVIVSKYSLQAVNRNAE